MAKQNSKKPLAVTKPRTLAKGDSKGGRTKPAAPPAAAKSRTSTSPPAPAVQPDKGPDRAASGGTQAAPTAAVPSTPPAQKAAPTASAAAPVEAKAADPGMEAAEAAAEAAFQLEEANRAAASRLPPVGTVIKKVGRDGQVRAECTVLEDGLIGYNGQKFRSLSGAAMAAAAAMGLTAASQNGYVFWGLQKPARELADPAERLNSLFDRYAQLATSLLKQGAREKVLEAIQPHAEQLAKLLRAG